MGFIDYGVGILFLLMIATFSVLSWIALVLLSRRDRKKEQDPRSRADAGSDAPGPLTPHR